MAGRMGGTGKNTSNEFKVRDTRNLRRGGPQGAPGLTRKDKRRMRKDIRQAARAARTSSDPRAANHRTKLNMELVLRITIATLTSACVLVWVAMMLT